MDALLIMVCACAGYMSSCTTFTASMSAASFSVEPATMIKPMGWHEPRRLPTKCVTLSDMATHRLEALKFYI